MVENLPSLGWTLKPAETTTWFNLVVAGFIGLGTIALTEGIKDKTAVPVKNVAVWALALGGLIAVAVYSINKSAV